MNIDIKKVLRFLTDARYFVCVCCSNGVMNWLPDRHYLPLFYWGHTGEKLDLKNPKTFNEKMQVLKLRDRDPTYTRMVDKVAAKAYVAERIGIEHIIPTLGVWNQIEDIDFDSLPNQFVLKCTHDSGGLVVCRDKSKLDYDFVCKLMRKTLRRNFYKYGREWPYKDVPRRIIAEEYMSDNEGDKEGLTDYKIFCFDGEPEFVMTVRDRRTSKITHRWYTKKWELTDLDIDGRGEKKIAESRPEQLEEMLEYARVLSKGLKHLRVDMYVIKGKVYFGELTFYHMSGTEAFYPKSWDMELGKYIHI